MKLSFKITALVMALILLCSACGSAPESAPAETPAPTPAATPAPEKADIPQTNLGYEIGKTLPDFSFTTYDGREMSLYQSLGEKELVVINLWATWCGPCGMEFPYMEEAYQQYKDSVEIFALSVEASDSDEKLEKYTSANGMSFPVGRDLNNLAGYFYASSIPTTILVDRYGTVCAIEVGAKTSTEAFTALFEQFVGEDYVPSVAAPEAENLPVCDVESSTPEALAAALNVEGGSISFENVELDSVWPFVVGEHEGRSVAVSTNAGIDGTASGIVAEFDAEAGQVMRIDFSLSCEVGTELMCIYLDGALVKSFSGEKGYMSYAFPIEDAGRHLLIISYGKDDIGSAGDDCLVLDSFALLSGAEAEAALKANPVYPVAEATSMHPTHPDAKEIILDDPYGKLISEDSEEYFSFWIIPGGEAEFLFSPGNEVDPESLVFFTDYDGSHLAAMDSPVEGGYSYRTPVASMDSVGFYFTSVYAQDMATPALVRAAICFADEANLESFLAQIVDGEGKRLVEWAYADGSEKQTPAEAVYSVSFTDQNGDGVPGVMLQVCDDSLCQVYTSDSSGLCSFSLPPYAYEMHILSIPDGYEGDTESVTIAPAEGGDVYFVLTKK